MFFNDGLVLCSCGLDLRVCVVYVGFVRLFIVVFAVFYCVYGYTFVFHDDASWVTLSWYGWGGCA